VFLGYVDETGDEDRIMHSALLVPARRWGSCTRTWLDWRKRVNRKYHVPANYEFHASALLHGNLDDLPSYRTEGGGFEEPRIKTSTGVQHELYWRSLRIAGYFPDAQVVTCHQTGTDRMASYQQLLDCLQEHLEEQDGHAVLLCDGTDVGHGAHHRALDTKTSRVIERPWMHSSHDHQFIQVADFIAYAAFQCVSRQPGKNELWPLYETLLAERIVYAPGANAGIFGL
jgi:hypothetical protein